MRKYKLSNSEEYLMEIFWSTSKPLTSIELLEKVTGFDWSINYIHKVINLLQDNGLIQVCGSIKQGKHSIRQFTPILAKEEFLSEMLIERGVGNLSIAKIAMSLVKKNTDIDETDSENNKLIAELEGIITRFEQAQKEEDK